MVLSRVTPLDIIMSYDISYVPANTYARLLSIWFINIFKHATPCHNQYIVFLAIYVVYVTVFFIHKSMTSCADLFKSPPIFS